MLLRLKKASGTFMSKSAIKFYLVPGIIAIIIVVFILIIPFGKKKDTNNPTPTTTIIIPTIILPTRASFSTPPPSEGSPTLIPIQEFTGADINQELPPDIRDMGIQKTSLRKKLPLALEFGTITFDYENDQLIVTLLQPLQLSKSQFTDWLATNYPALPLDKFAFQ